jgi:hypothetical protein
MFNMVGQGSPWLRRHLQPASVKKLAAVKGSPAADVVQPLGQLAHQRDSGSRGAATVTLLFALVPGVGDGILLNPTENDWPRQ